VPERVRRLPVLPLVPVLEDAEPATDEVLGADAAGAAASPQVSQYPSWIVPVQPGRVHLAGPAAGAGAAAVGAGPAGAGAAAATGSGASPQVSQYPPSIVPPQPGRTHLIAVVVMAAPSFPGNRMF
jgi:hypothetical protein